MPNTTTGSKVRKNTASAKNTSSKAKQTEVEPVAATVATDVTTPSEERATYKIKKDLSPNMVVTVKNGFNGTLVYKCKRTGEVFVWDAFGSEQEMELQDLKSAKNTYKAFFVNNWFLFDDPEIVEWLGMSQYYKHALNTDSFNEMFYSTPEEIKKTVAKLSAGQKKTAAFRAKQLIQEGEIDSIKIINALEESLSVELIER